MGLRGPKRVRSLDSCRKAATPKPTGSLIFGSSPAAGRRPPGVIGALLLFAPEALPPLPPQRLGSHLAYLRSSQESLGGSRRPSKQVGEEGTLGDLLSLGRCVALVDPGSQR